MAKQFEKKVLHGQVTVHCVIHSVVNDCFVRKKAVKQEFYTKLARSANICKAFLYERDADLRDEAKGLNSDNK